MVKSTITSDTANKYFNTKELVNLLDKHYSGKCDNSRKLWTVFVFILWYDKHFDEKGVN